MFLKPRPRLLALSLGTALVSTVWLVAVLASPRPTTSPEPNRADAVLQLVAEGQGLWDGHPDPDVGRVLQPNLEERRAGGLVVSSNSLGLREREFEVPKPPGRLRVVVLGDSYVFGNGVAAPERFGVHLERALVERSGLDAEVLHVGMTDWNAVACTQFLRRQLSLFAPDLVVHVLIYNDLDDASAARGFGAMASWSSQVRRHADGMLNTRHPFAMGFGGVGAKLSLLNAGIDHESRARYADARRGIQELVGALGASGAQYLAVLHWPDHGSVAARELLAPLPPRSRAFVPARIFRSAEHRVSIADAHWNGAAHREVAEMLYGAIEERGLLGAAPIAPWPEARARLTAWNQEGMAECGAPFDLLALRGGQPVRSRLRFDPPDALVAAQVHGGIDARGRAAPFASFVLANGGAAELVLEIGPAPGPGLLGQAEVSVEGEVVGRFELARAPARHGFALPPQLLERPYLNVRLRSDDWVLGGPRQQRCFSLQLVEASLASPRGDEG